MMDKILEIIERRWTLAVLTGALIGSSIGLLGTITAPDVYVARSLVVLTNASIPPEEFAGVAGAMFPTDAVLRPVIRQLGLDRTPSQLIADGSVSLEPQPGGLAVNVVARTNGPDLAVAIANATAAQLADVSQINGIGELAEFPAEGPAGVQADSPLRGIALGALIGAVIAALDVAIVFLFRRRSLGSDGRFRFDAMVRASVTAATEETTSPTVSAAYPLGALLGMLGEEAGGHEVVAVVLDGGRDLWASLAAADELRRLAEGRRSGGFRVLSPGEEPSDEDTAGPVLVIAADHTPASRLRDLRRRLRDSNGDATTALLLVRAFDGG